MNPTSFFSVLRSLSWFPVVMIVILVWLGVMTLYSAADGSFVPWGEKQLMRFVMGMGCMLWMVCIRIRVLYHFAYYIYGFALLLLVAVEVLGFTGMGAQRWINLGIFNLQPSELMRLGLILAIARYFHELPQQDVNHPRSLVLPIVLLIVPTLLVMRQPDLGTALLLLLSSASIFFLANVSMWYFVGVGALLTAAIPVLWQLLHDYQKKRVLIFLNPESDPIHSGYHIIQSKIALGSGGVWGKGFLMGTQSHLDFLPEKQTDFIFTMFCEEFGMMGAIGLIILYSLLILYNARIAMHAKGLFSKLVASSLTVTFFLYMFINMAMVMGLLPVVGIPLPLFSYGGTAMITLLISQGILLGIDCQDVKGGQRWR